MPLASSRQQLIRDLFDTYRRRYLNRDPALLDDFSANFTGYTGCGTELVRDLAQWQAITRTDFAQVPDPIEWEMLDLAVQDLAEDVVAAIAFFHIHLPLNANFLAGETARLVLIFRREDDVWKVAHSGISLPYQVPAQNDEIYPLHSFAQRTRLLEAEVVARTAELAAANRKLEQLSQTDGLTGIANRRLFDTRLHEAWRHANRQHESLALAMVDVDFFKRYNDHYGHLVGDECLRQLAHALAGFARRSGDLAARYGGEEFVLLLPHTDAQQMLAVCRQFLHAVDALALPHTDSPFGRVTVSIGVASVSPSRAQDSAQLIAQADAALYQAKQTGRHRITLAES